MWPKSLSFLAFVWRSYFSAFRFSRTSSFFVVCFQLIFPIRLRKHTQHASVLSIVAFVSVQFSQPHRITEETVLCKINLVAAKLDKQMVLRLPLILQYRNKKERKNNQKKPTCKNRRRREKKQEDYKDNNSEEGEGGGRGRRRRGGAVGARGEGGAKAG